jgi:biotin transporter BioY
LLTVRAALLLGFAVIIALGAAWLMLATHRPVAATALGAIAVLAAALKLLNDLVE